MKIYKVLGHILYSKKRFDSDDISKFLKWSKLIIEDVKKMHIEFWPDFFYTQLPQTSCYRPQSYSFENESEQNSGRVFIFFLRNLNFPNITDQ